ncbi:hypothetical protein AGOR_G00187510 [Albula goreensis]|uniref:Uncharacterized protein n=1 Tax=Albula goreensis TaxID=1534307 RepID=A0A8T3D204_9TELE|nr:hypothetical protein AGOR_G00187510 [Albula goreensis]
MQSVGSPGTRSLSEEQFQCSICLEVFVEPVSTPCGHSFCKACLQGYWSHSRQCVCPMCKKSFSKKPELSVNRVLAEISAHFQGLGVAEARTGQEDGSGEGQGEAVGGDFARPGDVACDSCIGRKLKAVRSCLHCRGSYCEAHLLPHRRVKALAAHRLTPPLPRLDDQVCRKHQRLLELYCRNDHTCVCPSCADATHRTHDIVSVEREWKRKMSHLGKRRSEVKHLIKERSKKLEEIKQSIKVIKVKLSTAELEESWKVYAELQRWVEQSQAELVAQITERQQEAERQAHEFAHALEEELAQLRKRSSELEDLAHTDDKLLLLQRLPSLPPAPEPKDWSGVSVNTDLYVGIVRSSVSALLEKNQDLLRRLYSRELRKLQNYASEVFLDPATAQRSLGLSTDGRKVWAEERKQTQQQDGSQRFHPALFVLGREALSSGRHYWEVDVGSKTAWTLGVTRQSARRKGEIKLGPEGGFWCLWLKGGQVKALSSTHLPLLLPALPSKVGVYLDYEAGQVSFYDVKAHAHLYTFMDAFTESVLPIFSPCPAHDGKNSAPLIITAVKHS